MMLNQDKLTNVGAKPYDVVLMFKIMILQRYYGINDEQTEYQILDRLSFRNFLGLSTGESVPDARTIWVFKDNLAKNGVSEKLFELFHKFLENNNLIMNEGKIVDASFVLAPKQRNTPEENNRIKNGE